jgi:hypothetical protein
LKIIKIHYDYSCYIYYFLSITILGEYKRLVSNLMDETNKMTIIEKKVKKSNNDENEIEKYEDIEIKKDQIKRLFELQKMAGEMGEIPGA